MDFLVTWFLSFTMILLALMFVALAMTLIFKILGGWAVVIGIMAAGLALAVAADR